MNFTRAVRGQLTVTSTIDAIQSQAETELNRKLTKAEEGLLFRCTDPAQLLNDIQKV